MELNLIRSSPYIGAEEEEEEEDSSRFYSKQSLNLDFDSLVFAKTGLEDKYSLRPKRKKPSLQLPRSPRSTRCHEIIHKVWELNMKKDVVSLILSYPPLNSQNNGAQRGWIRDVLRITQKAREALHTEKEVNVPELSSEMDKLLSRPVHIIKVHVPEDILVNMCKGLSPMYQAPPEAMLDWCIDDFMIRQILQCIQGPEIQRILLSEVNDKNFLFRLKNLSPIRRVFNLIIQVDVRFCSTVKDIEDRIIKQLSFSNSNRREAEQLLRSQNFLILLDDFDPWIENLHHLGNCWWSANNTQKIVLASCQFYPGVPMDLEIRRNHHLLSWELFCRNVGEVVHSSTIQKLAVHVLRQCSGHLRATVLMARALKGVNNVRIWQHAFRVIGFQPTLHVQDRIMINALIFILGHLGSASKCVKYCAFYLEMEGTDKMDLLKRWMREDLIGTLDKGEQIVQHLVDAHLLESFANGESVRMDHEIRKELVMFYKAEMYPTLLVELDARELTEAPKNEAWEEANEMSLMNNKISKLPENPNCPKLRVLFLQGNRHLRVISSSFFQCMPILQVLHLSNTKIKSLPPSFFKLVQLRKFFLRSCELFMELPTEIGELCHLEVLDLEGTDIINLPASVGKLTNLTRLKLSFCPQINHCRKNNHRNTIIPQNVVSNLLQLKQLSIDVDPEDERWNAAMKYIVKEVCCLKWLCSLKLHLPEVLVLNDLWDVASSVNLSRMKFRFIVGRHQKRMISRLSHESAIRCEEQETCLKYLNGEGIPTGIKVVLQHATALFLDRHLTVTSLSEFGIENTKNLKFCVLSECDEIQTILDVDNDRNGVLSSLAYLELYYMKNLTSIWKGKSSQMPWLFNLKVLALHTCPKLDTIFTFNLLIELNSLEELVVEDCPEINSIVTHEVLAQGVGSQEWYLPKLKKLSLHYMPKLASISGALAIAPELEWLSLYDCPNLKILHPEEVSSCKLKVIAGEADWWNELKWKASQLFQPPNLDAIFVPIERYADLRTQLVEINDQLQAEKQKTEPSQQSGPGHSLKLSSIEAGTSSKQK